jgi:ubiquinone/menaquinone biosynthesis C-methylase UbiE
VAYYFLVPDNRDLVRERFTRTAEQFAKFSLSTRAVEAAHLVALAAPRGDELALDLACGPGTFTRALAARVRLIHGLDITPALLAQARAVVAKERLTNILFECGDAYSLPYPQNKFDLASCAFALHHMDRPGDALLELARVLRPGGRLALVDIVVPDGCDPAAANAIERARDASHTSTLRPADLLALCASAGFRVDLSEPSERLRSFDDWMQIAGWRPADPAYIATRRLLESHIPRDSSGFQPRPGSSPSADLEFVQPSLFLIATK